MKQKLNHSQSIDTLKHCFEQVFLPLDDAGDRLEQLRRLWRCCCALFKSNVFNERWRSYNSRETGFPYRIYRRLWRLYFYRNGIDVLLYSGIPYLTAISRPTSPEITFY